MGMHNTEDSSAVSVPLDESAVMRTSVIRTLVPVVVGYFSSFGICTGTDSVTLTSLVTLLITVSYYIIVRMLEHYVSASFGALLGVEATPTYLRVVRTHEIEEDTTRLQ